MTKPRSNEAGFAMVLVMVVAALWGMIALMTTQQLNLRFSSAQVSKVRSDRDLLLQLIIQNIDCRATASASGIQKGSWQGSPVCQSTHDHLTKNKLELMRSSMHGDLPIFDPSTRLKDGTYEVSGVLIRAGCDGPNRSLVIQMITKQKNQVLNDPRWNTEQALMVGGNKKLPLCYPNSPTPRSVAQGFVVVDNALGTD
ncbi:MAG: hypothetical protein EOP10_06300 [Proteobacteria bacterium]|nr:MAG: hypothetical protein EOP10_06300 [Pseudomonadota bacterium]